MFVISYWSIYIMIALQIFVRWSSVISVLGFIDTLFKFFLASSCFLICWMIFSRNLDSWVLYSECLDHILEKAVAPHSSTLAWKIPWMEEPGRLQPMGSLRVGHDWATLLSLFTFMHWRRKWHPTPVFLSGESQGQRSLVGCRLWGHTESDTTEVT